jgi:hypothetical protein
MRIATLWVIVTTLCVAAFGQAYPTNNVFFRVAMIQSQYGRGTTFSIDVDQREYWITAKHIITGSEHPPYGTVDTTKQVSLKILDPGATEERWVTVPFSVIDAGIDVDIVALAPPNPLLRNPIATASFEGAQLLLGGDCTFLGFPFGGGWRMNFDATHSYWMPFVKHCSISSLPGNHVMILDGINNHGFSGGPVLYQTGPDQKIMGVISGYMQEPAEVLPSAQRLRRPLQAPPNRPGHVNLNSGFIVAYFIDPVIAAIRKNPIGPQRPPKA